MPCPELPYHPEILSLTLSAIMLNVFGAVRSPAQYSESIYCQHNTVTLLTLYTPNFEAYISKLNVAPSSLGLSCYSKTLSVIACVQWN